MSVSSTQGKHPAQTPPGSAKRTKFARIKSAIDAQLDEIIKDILPNTPYILRTPRDNGNPISKTHSSPYWLRGTPLVPGEQELQYMTFRQSPEGMLHSLGLWDDGNGGIPAPERPLSRASSAHTPGQSQPVKKLNFTEYLNREKSKSVGKDAAPQQKTKELAKGEANGPVERQHDIEPHAAKTNGQNPTDSEKPSRSPIGQNQPGQQRRTVKQPVVNRQSLEHMPPGVSATPSPPAKKRRLSSENNVITQLEESTQKSQDLSEQQVKTADDVNKSSYANDPSQEKPKAAPYLVEDTDITASRPASAKETSKKDRSPKLPPMLSPTLPTAEAYRLPPLLSPTLPKDVEEAILELKAKVQKAADQNANSLNRAKSPSLHAPSGTDRVKAPGETAKESKKGVSPAAADRANHLNGVSNPSKLRENEDLRPTEKMRKVSLIVKLRIKRKQSRRELSQYLNLRPTPNKVHWERKISPEHRASFTPSKEPALPSLKRERICFEEGTARKRRRGSDSSTLHAETPLPPGSSPPTTRPLSAQKPRLDARPTSAAMRRAGSGQSLATTPQGQSRHGTPSVADKESPSKQERLRVEYRAEMLRLANIGRDLKHEADRYLKPESRTEDDVKIGLVLGTEAVLAFILAAAVLDEPPRREGLPGHTSQWKTVLPLLGSLTFKASSYPYLFGLLCQLEGLTRDVIHNYETIHFRAILREQYAQGDEPPLQKNHAFIKEYVENEMRTEKLWPEGYANLWLPDLQKHFPKTWGKARQVPGKGKAQDSIDLKDYTKDGFALPMGKATSAIEGVNAGMCFLQEHCELEKLDWKAKLIL
ncbi:uncharacterized protein KY384_000227 [Bacidia gigantensis]|uniref:uncharacterized protein n=1 Tax=Bacidia gigantensis TaxID=2732470 RepID=UPI001D0429FF|nr:uncharacterized protein KY384_000227 [Bacidia gigantensis]KAG8526234.1 hypothetical protein KY384_000227 [Bacidia gigantensis]